MRPAHHLTIRNGHLYLNSQDWGVREGNGTGADIFFKRSVTRPAGYRIAAKRRVEGSIDELSLIEHPPRQQ